MTDKLSDQELANRLSEAGKMVIIGAEYTHYKNKPYKVLDLAILEENTEVAVIYQAQYGQRVTFIRPLSDWIKKVEWQGKTVQRFTKI